MLELAANRLMEYHHTYASIGSFTGVPTGVKVKVAPGTGLPSNVTVPLTGTPAGISAAGLRPQPA
jgi:hypothetical protein